MQTIETDFLVIGSGIGGLWAALGLAERGRVTVITKDLLTEGSTLYAQGGVAVAWRPDDSPELHLEDTIRAGAGLCDSHAARILTEEGPEQVAKLIRFGARFDTDNGALALTREAAHRARRIAHALGDATGREIARALSVQAASRHEVKVLEHTFLLDFLMADGCCLGASTLDLRTGEELRFRAQATLLASGGIGQVYKVTTNPPVVTGDGIAAAFRAGAALADMEIIQFHPTALDEPSYPKFLISEAVRGEGAVLRNADGERFMPHYHPDAELAPRDVVARAIMSEMQRAGQPHVFVDLREIPQEVVRRRFPNIAAHCRELGIDILADLVPVTPAAHYLMGGVVVDVDGRSSAPGLYACGEVACTGVHGANRLASNSMLEALVFGARCIEAMADGALALDRLGGGEVPAVGPVGSPLTADAQRELRARLRDLTWDCIGVLRSAQSLARAEAELAELAGETAPAPPTQREAAELRNMVTVARLVARAAATRTESRGAHYRTDYGEADDSWRRRISLTQGADGHIDVGFLEAQPHGDNASQAE
ncbi:MAG: L-aspartate oxidase [Armatimonadota bacterium]